MVAPGSDWSDSVVHAASARTDQIALALDGVPSASMSRTLAAYQLAFSLYGGRFQKTLAQLRALPASAIVLVASKLVKSPQIMQILDLPHTFVESLHAIPESPKVVFLGCQDSASLPENEIVELLAEGATLITSDKSALTSPMSDALRPTSPRPARIARVRWLATHDLCMGHPAGIDTHMLPGVQLPAGHIPVAVDDTTSAQLDVIAVDSLTDEPLIVRAEVGGGRLLHAVPHWWQHDSIARTVVDRRQLSVIPSFASLGARVSDVTFGELQAARTMLCGLMTGLGAGAR